MRGIVGLTFLAVLFTDGAALAQNPTGSMILAEGFAEPNTFAGICRNSSSRGALTPSTEAVASQR